MLSRRDLITAGVAGSVVPAAAAPMPSEQDADRDGQRDIARRLGEVQDVLKSAFQTSSLSHGIVAKLRSDMETFLRANAKFPDFIEVGIAVFIVFGFAQFAGRGMVDFGAVPAYVHLHGVIMLVWLGLAVTQATLIRAGAQAVFAEGIDSASYILYGLFKTDRTIRQIFWSDPARDGRWDFSFASSRTPGYHAEMDPLDGSNRYYRSVIGNLDLTATKWRMVLGSVSTGR